MRLLQDFLFVIHAIRSGLLQQSSGWHDATVDAVSSRKGDAGVGVSSRRDVGRLEMVKSTGSTVLARCRYASVPRH